MNKSMWLSMATMLSMNAEAEQKSSRFQRCTAHVRNHKKTYGAIGAVAILAGCVAIGLSLKQETDMPDDPSTAATRKALIQQVQNELHCGTVTHVVRSGISYYYFNNNFTKASDINVQLAQVESAVNRILRANPSAVVSYNADDGLSNLLAACHVIDNQTTDIVLDAQYWNLEFGGYFESMDIWHIFAKNSQQSRMLVCLRKDISTQITVSNLNNGYEKYKEACAVNKHQSSDTIECIVRGTTSERIDTIIEEFEKTSDKTVTTEYLCKFPCPDIDDALLVQFHMTHTLWKKFKLFFKKS